jgi:PKD repeat protein
MKPIFKYLYTLLLAVFLLSAGISCVHAQCMTYEVSLAHRISDASSIIEGKVISKNSFWNTNQDFIYTSNIIEVYKVFKGNLTSHQLEIITEGGIVGQTMIKAEPSLQFETDEVGIFFLIPSTQPNPFSPFPPSLQMEGIASIQSFIRYDLKSLTATDPYNHYTDLSVSLYQEILNQTGQQIIEIIPFNLFPSQNLGPGNPTPTAFPVITAITSPSTAGTFTIVTITGNNFGAGPYGGTRLVEFRDANNGGAGFIPVPANHVVSWANGSIQVRVPTQAGSGNIRVTNDLNEATISGVTITINYNQSNVISGGVYYQPDLINDNGTGGYNFVYNNTFNGNAAAVASFERALQTWRCGTFVNFNRVGTTATACQALDNTNLVTFDGSCALPSGVLGVSYSYYSSCGGGVWYLNENDLKFRTNGTGGINWNYGPAPTAGGLFDFESVSLHELGHSHQLGHTITPVTVMNYAIGPNTDRRTLTPVSETAGGNDIMSRSVVNNSCGPSAMVALNGSNCSINAPIADFSGTPTSGCNSLVVNFTDLSVGTPTSWNWSFPGGAPAAFVGQNPPAITYGAPGTYNVTLTVSNASGNDTRTKNAYIVVNNCPPPVADFNASPTTVCTNQQVFFMDASTNSPTSWSWSFPGGSPATSVAQNPAITYAAPGVYNVSLTATNAYGSGSVTKNSYITVNTCPVPPVANFSGSPTTLCAGGNVSFTDLSSNSPTSWEWTFPGGTPATSIAQNPVITYNTAGTYSVTLKATNGAGSHTTTFNAYITVNVCSPPTVDFVGWPTTVCTGSSVSFLDQSTNSPTSWTWTFPGGTPAGSAVQNPVITYNTAGTYNVTLQAFNSFGNNTLTKTTYITVATCPAFGSGLIVNDGSLIQIETGALVAVEGGFINQDNGVNIGRIDNWGLMTLTGDWTNNSGGAAFINSSPGTTELMGAAQTITGTTTTNFYNLTLSGSGIKTLNINTIVEGTLALNDRELATQGNWMHVLNPNTNAITRTGALNSTPVQGFVSSTGNGRLRRSTNSSSTYLFPVGSSQGNPRFRPVALKPTDASANVYAVRFVNNDPTIDGFPITMKDPNIGNINPYWYQKLNGVSGTTNPDITLYFDNVQDNIAPLPSLLMAQWAYNAPPTQWRAISGVLVSGAASPVLSSTTKAAWVSFNTENFNLAPQSIPLPVDYLSFTGSCLQDNITVKWVTASERFNDYFLLERSYDGINYSEIARINGSGTTSSISEYSYEDRDILSGRNVYYRLSQFDFNGDPGDPKLIVVDCRQQVLPYGVAGIYPNPFSSEINIILNHSAPTRKVVTIYDVIGKLVYSEVYVLDAGMHQLTVNLEHLAPGMYQIRIDHEGPTFTSKIIRH